MHISLSRVEAWLLCKRGSGRSRVHALCTVHSKTAAIPVVSGRYMRVARRSLASMCIQAWQNISGVYKHGLHTRLACIKAWCRRRLICLSARLLSAALRCISLVSPNHSVVMGTSLRLSRSPRSSEGNDNRHLWGNEGHRHHWLHLLVPLRI